ncbi:hypothetical protein F4805DRAFT_326158 [Annulohypoxylon moriforme]|nr:hypothetical protein F4805DRAFT_326158 [Annulohypoxylon moriforme]
MEISCFYCFYLKSHPLLFFFFIGMGLADRHACIRRQQRRHMRARTASGRLCEFGGFGFCIVWVSFSVRARERVKGMRWMDGNTFLLDHTSKSAAAGCDVPAYTLPINNTPLDDFYDFDMVGVSLC